MVPRRLKTVDASRALRIASGWRSRDTHRTSSPRNGARRSRGAPPVRRRSFRRSDGWRETSRGHWLTRRCAAIRARPARRNTTGDEQKPLDLWSHEVMGRARAVRNACAAYVSEEAAEPIEMPEGAGPHGIVAAAIRWTGSSNLDVGRRGGDDLLRCVPRGAARPQARPRWGRWAIRWARAMCCTAPATFWCTAWARALTASRSIASAGSSCSRIPTSRCRRRARPTASTRGISPAGGPGQRAFVEHLRTPDKRHGAPVRAPLLGGHGGRRAPHPSSTAASSCIPRTCRTPPSPSPSSASSTRSRPWRTWPSTRQAREHGHRAGAGSHGKRIPSTSGHPGRQRRGRRARRILLSQVSGRRQEADLHRERMGPHVGSA